MTDGGDKPDKPAKPDPFAPLPLADLPPVRGKEASGPVPKSTKATKPAKTDEPSGAIAAPRAKTPSIPPTAFAQPSPAPEDVTWTASSGERVGAGAALAELAELGPAGSPPTADPTTAAGEIAAIPSGAPLTGPQTWETPVGLSWSEPAPSATPEAWTEAPRAPAAPEPLLPAAYDDNELRAAVGVTPRVEPEKPAKSAKKAKKPAPVRDDEYDDDDGGGKRRSRKGMLVGALAIVLGGGITAMVLLGKANAERFYLTCEADQVVVEQGRSFPPWGSSALGGAEWKPLKIPPETVCTPRETEDQAELAAWYLKMLTDFAEKQLSARDATRVDESEAVLKQALLVSRLLPGDAAKDARNEIDRLLGDVVYWRATARLKGATDALSDAAKQFDAAAAARPAHFKDAAEWAKHTRELAERLRAGPGGMPSVALPPAPTPERPTAPPGVALPVEPDGSGSAEPAPAPAPAPTPPSSGVMI